MVKGLDLGLLWPLPVLIGPPSLPTKFFYLIVFMLVQGHIQNTTLNTYIFINPLVLELPFKF